MCFKEWQPSCPPEIILPWNCFKLQLRAHAHHSHPDLVTCRTLQPRVQKPQLLALPLSRQCWKNITDSGAFRQHMWDGINQSSSLYIHIGSTPHLERNGHYPTCYPGLGQDWVCRNTDNPKRCYWPALYQSPQINAIKEHHFPTAVQVFPKSLLSPSCSHCFFGKKSFSLCTQQQNKVTKRKRWVPSAYDKKKKNLIWITHSLLRFTHTDRNETKNSGWF